MTDKEKIMELEAFANSFHSGSPARAAARDVIWLIDPNHITEFEVVKLSSTRPETTERIRQGLLEKLSVY